MRALVRAHPVFTGLLLAGLALRVVTFFAYRPALIYYDSTRYLDRLHDLEPSTLRPLGYPLFLKLLPTDWELAVVPAVQHLFGLAIAVLIYAVLLRLGLPKLWGALATVPVLFDGYQLNIEQYILSEPLFELLLVGGLRAAPVAPAAGIRRRRARRSAVRRRAPHTGERDPRARPRAADARSSCARTGRAPRRSPSRSSCPCSRTPPGTSRSTATTG